MQSIPYTRPELLELRAFARGNMSALVAYRVKCRDCRWHFCQFCRPRQDLPSAYSSSTAGSIYMWQIKSRLSRSPAPLKRARGCLVTLNSKLWHYEKKRFPVTSNLRYMHGVLNVDKIKKLIAQFGCTLRDERFEPN